MMNRCFCAAVALVVWCCVGAEIPLYQISSVKSAVTLSQWSAHYLQNDADMGTLEFVDDWCETNIPDRLAQKTAVFPGVKKKGDWNSAQGALYRADLQAEVSFQTSEVILTLPYTMHESEVFLDGKRVAFLWDGSLPQDVDLTPYLVPGKRHSLAIRVKSYTASTKDTNGKQKYPNGLRWHKGLLGAPVLKVLSRVRPEEMTVYAQAGMVTLGCVVRNRQNSVAEGTLEWSVEDLDGKTIYRHQEKPLRLNASSEKQVSHVFSVKDGELKLWDVGQPNLYRAKVVFHTKNGDADETTRFGYRWVEIRGDSFFLNGRHVRLRGPWGHFNNWMAPRLAIEEDRYDLSGDPRNTFRRLLDLGCNYARLHQQPFPLDFYEAADELGYLLIAESALHHYISEKSIAQPHLERFVKTLRNHPSVAIWSASNEFVLWESPRPQWAIDFFVWSRDVIKRLDPQRRPVQHSGIGDANGQLDIYSVHYPALVETWPTSLYWTRNPKRLARANIIHNFLSHNPVGKKPLFYGEELMPNINVDRHTYYTGTEGVRHACAALVDPKLSKPAQLDLARTWRLYVRAEREQNIGAISPILFYLGLESAFTRELAKEFRPAGAYPMLEPSVLVAGEKNPRRFAVFEDDGFARELSIQVSLRKADGQELPLAAWNETMAGGDLHEVSRVLELPAELPEGPAILVTRTRQGDETLHEDETPVFILRKGVPQMLQMEVATLGSSAPLQSFAMRHGVQLQSANLGNLPKDGVLLVMPDMAENELLAHSRELAAFAERGGRVLVFERPWEQSFLPGNVTFNQPDSLCGVGFIRLPAHPAFQGLDDCAFRFWNQDLSIAGQSAIKNGTGNIQTLLDATTGLEQRLLWEMETGQGRFLVNHLHILANLEKLPHVDRFLCNLLAYLRDVKPRKTLRARGLAAPGDDLFLTDWSGLGVSPDSPGETIVLASSWLASHTATEAAEACKTARNILVLNPPREVVGDLSIALVGKKLSTMPASKKSKSNSPWRCYFREDDELYRGLTSKDLDWGGEILPPFAYNARGDWKSCISGGRDAFCRRNGRTVLFLNLPYDRDVPTPARKLHFSNALLHNLGCAIPLRPAAQMADSPDRFRTVSLETVTNASRSSSLADFPTGLQTFDGIPFRLPVESKAAPHAMLRLSALWALPKEAAVRHDTAWDKSDVTTSKTIIRLPAAQANALHFIATATHNWKINAYKTGATIAFLNLVYTDGTSARLPLVNKLNIHAARDVEYPVPQATRILVNDITCNAPGDKAKIYHIPWLNPFPERKIKYLEIQSAGNPPFDLLVFAITLERTALEFD
ncbi:MAG: hypothetical protein IJJ26_10760 [Victivallales bacterium]|nr:hypothetical protein [Victivallales bacterium]